MIDGLNFLLWNCNGSSQKKKNLIRYIITKFNLNICFLVETHDNKNYAPRDWREISNPSKNAGVTIIYDPNTLKVEYKNENRYISGIIKNKQQQLKFILLYAESSSKNKDTNWWKQMNMDQYYMILGDFNIVLDEKRDTISGSGRSYRGSRKVVQEELANFTDLAVHVKNLEMTYYHESKPCSRLDRIYLKPHFLNFAYGILNNPNYNDHSLIIVTHKKSQRSWMFKNYLFPHRKYDEIIKDQTVTSNPEWGQTKSQIINKIKKLQSSKIKEQYSLLNKLTFILKRKIPKNSPKIIRYQKQIDSILELINTQRKIKLSAGDVDNKDLPSRFMSMKLNSRDGNRRIEMVKDPETKIPCDTDADIAAAFHKFYSKLYDETTINPRLLKRMLRNWKIDNQDYSHLAEDFTADELEYALKNVNPHKSPGPDGLSFRVYQNLDSSSKTALLNTFNEFLHGKTIPSEWKTGTIITLFKKDDPTDIGNYRPITLLNCDYKLLSKMVTIRLNAILDPLIDNGQIGFMQNRLIYDNIIALDTMIKEKNYAINIDFMKAYDSVSHEAIKIVLDHIKLPRLFKNLIMNMLTDSQAKLLINGTLSESFTIKRGVKQGDVMSPLLFTLVIEILQKIAINKAKHLHAPTFNEHHIGMLLYADDITICTQNKKGIERWHKILQRFHKATGLQMNLSKSSITYYKHVDSAFKQSQGTFMYLGIPFNNNGIDKNAVKEKIVNSVQNSLNRFIMDRDSPFARVSIIKSYCLSKLWHSCFVYFLDKGTITKLDKLLNKALWVRKSLSEKPRYLVSSKRVTKPKSCGGLNLWKLKERFIAFNASIVERLLLDKKSKSSIIWQPYLNLNFLYKFVNYNAKAKGTIKIHLECWRKCLPPLPSHTDFLKRVSSYKTLKQLQSQLKINEDKNAFKPTWTPRQSTLNARLNLSNLFMISHHMPNRTLASFFWRYLQGGLPFKHGTPCPICKLDTLSYKHIFFECNQATIISAKFNKIVDTLCSHKSTYNPSITFKISLIWNENFALANITNYNDTLSALIMCCLHTIWIAFTRSKHEKTFSANEVITHNLSTTCTALYKNFKNNFIPDIEEYENKRSNFLKQWGYPNLWLKVNNNFLPKTNLFNIID